jgi:hypothetical protein
MGEYLPLSTRAAHYWALADATHDLAREAEDLELLRIYLDLAARYISLACEAELSASRQPGLGSDLVVVPFNRRRPRPQ